MSENKQKQFTILYIEDEKFLREMYEEIFTQKGIRVIALPDAKDQVEIMQKEKDSLDLVISGIIHPGIDGLKMLKKIKAMPDLKHIPYVIFDNLAEERYIKEAYDLGAQAYYLLSDVEPNQFVEEIIKLLNTPKN